MSKRILGLLSFLLFVALAYAGDVWKDKPYNQWDEKDVRKILNDSPWAKTVRVDANWRLAGGSDSARSPQGSNPPMPTGGGGMAAPMGGGGGYGTGSSNSPGAGGQQVPDATFQVLWSSSRIMREAILRSRVLRGTIKEDEADKALVEDPPEYWITISGQDMTPFLKAEEKDLQTKSYLMLKKEKTKFAPARVVIQRKEGAKADDPQGVSAIIFLFAKKDAAGQPAINPQEKNLEFVCDAGMATVRTSFDLQKMAGSQGPDW